MRSNASSREGAEATDVIHDLLQLERAERGEAGQRLELAVEADDRRPADLEVDVARAPVDGGAQDLAQLHEIPFGGRVARSVRCAHISRHRSCVGRGVLAVEAAR